MTTPRADSADRAPVLEVLDPGLLSTVQDLGRVGYEHLGVPHAGACDRWGHAVANALIGNAPDAAAIEMTLIGPSIRALGPCVIGLGGADLGAVVERTGARIEPGTTHALREGDVVRIAGGLQGARGYLALPGGVDVPPVLGSRSTYLPASMGGLDGRALRAGDLLAAVSGAGDEGGPRIWPGPASLEARADLPAMLRVVDGPDAQGLARGLDTLLDSTWTIDPGSDRTGVRLVAEGGRAIPGVGQLVSRPVTWGAIQVPPSGSPIVLQADHQTVGGYAVPAVVITADLPVLAQLRPGTAVRFARVTAPEAIEALRTRAEAFRFAVEQAHGDAVWQDLWLNIAG